MTPPQLLRHTLSKEADPDQSREIRASLGIAHGYLMVEQFIRRVAIDTTKAEPDSRHPEEHTDPGDSPREEEHTSQSHY